MGEKIKTCILRFPARENPNMEKALFDWPIVLQYDVKAKYRMISKKFSGMRSIREYREEKSLRHVAMVAKFLDDNKPKKSLKSLFALKLHRSYSFSFNLANLLWDLIYRYLSLENESDNFCVIFTYSIKRAREIRKFMSK